MVGVASDALARPIGRGPYHGHMPGSRAVSLWLPVVIWAAVIFTFSSIPSLGTGLGVWDTILRKGAHMTEYAILGLLLLRALGRELPALAVGIGYAILDEVHQHFVRGRHASPVDVLIDTVGLAIGIFLVSRLFETRPVPGTGQVP
jgi:VanZ like family